MNGYADLPYQEAIAPLLESHGKVVSRSILATFEIQLPKEPILPLFYGLFLTPSILKKVSLSK